MDLIPSDDELIIEAADCVDYVVDSRVCLEHDTLIDVSDDIKKLQGFEEFKNSIFCSIFNFTMDTSINNITLFTCDKKARLPDRIFFNNTLLTVKYNFIITKISIELDEISLLYQITKISRLEDGMTLDVIIYSPI